MPPLHPVTGSLLLACGAFRGHGHICVTCADDRLLPKPQRKSYRSNSVDVSQICVVRQYTVDGIPRPTFQQMVFLQDDMVDFPDIGRLFWL